MWPGGAVCAIEAIADLTKSVVGACSAARSKLSDNPKSLLSRRRQRERKKGKFYAFRRHNRRL